MGELARLNLQIAWCRYGMDAQAKTARDATWQASEAALDGGSGRLHGAPAGDGRLVGDVVCGA